MASVDGSKSVQASSDEGHEFECDPCRYDDERKEAVSFCMQCGEYLCSTCCTTHKKFSMSRNHQVVSGSAMPRKGIVKAMDSSQNADVKCSCNCKNVTIYCKEHNDIMCDDCQRLKHRVCKTMSIDQASKQVKLPRKEDTLNNVNKLKETVESLKINRNKDNETLEIQSSECRRQIKDFSQELREKIAKLEKAALDEVADYETKHRKEIEQHIDTCTTAITKLEIDYQLFETTPATEDNLLFIRNLQLKKTMEHVEQALQDMEREVTKSNIDFEGDTSILSDIKSLGNVNTSNMSTGRPVIADTRKSTSRPVIADMTVKSTRKVGVKNPTDSTDPFITGSVFMPNGELILCDCSGNKSVKQFSADLTFKEQIKLASQPWDIDIVTDNEVVVSLPFSHSLTFLKVSPKLQQGSSIQLDQVCRGVAVDGGSIFVSFDNGEVRVLDRAGNQLKNLYSLHKFNLPYYISVPKPGMLCVSEHIADTVRMLNNGKEVYTFKHSGLQRPFGMYIDAGNNVFICGFNSHNVHVIDSNGKHKKVLLTKNDGLNRPYAISFRPSDNTLVVGGIMGSNILVCKLG